MDCTMTTTEHPGPHSTGHNDYGYAETGGPHAAPSSPLNPPIAPLEDEDGEEPEDFVTDTESLRSRSDYDEDFMETYSLSSSILDYQYENGRRYASFRSGHYMMPNDEEEQERLDLTHHIYLMLMGGELYNAPIKNPQKVLDLGTGTGNWAIDFADSHPGAMVVGNDLSPIQPSWVPPNVDFFVDDYEADWLEKLNAYDFIHSRNLAGYDPYPRPPLHLPHPYSHPSAHTINPARCVMDWHRLIRQAYDHLKPGGYLELQESAVWAWSDDGTLTMDSPLMEYLMALNDAGHMIGRELNIYIDLKPWLLAHGFEDVHEQTYILPFSPWPQDPRLREIGRVQAAMVEKAVEAYGLRLCTQVLGWSQDRTRIMQSLVRQQLKDRSQHSYTKIKVVYGRKPLI
ncbi:class I SAM-dependent methyltransferase [Aspergillus saccharolyticus JOP 1030-1]|uniref:S-adenosyl-L-methionine-dependent methyltransferase n=1 Tax=Aspergillus saccharolyticus JOP 1030-1 TaxID=1450539 RepID=A0A318Z023_9EURO|nr:S-adenosyl-L-methionine-dependent methyltransferase [Aspergillus saccharolyticus JOP 1030-1]PYH40229.1 S-adenosyl-L-methionine-dependent methyltransferase [Aspergillus saccharolyticus JOP 1030-1]